MCKYLPKYFLRWRKIELACLLSVTGDWYLFVCFDVLEVNEPRVAGVLVECVVEVIEGDVLVGEKTRVGNVTVEAEVSSSKS